MAFTDNVNPWIYPPTLLQMYPGTLYRRVEHPVLSAKLLEGLRWWWRWWWPRNNSPLKEKWHKIMRFEAQIAIPKTHPSPTYIFAGYILLNPSFLVWTMCVQHYNVSGTKTNQLVEKQFYLFGHICWLILSFSWHLSKHKYELNYKTVQI